MISNKFTGPGQLKMDVLTEANVRAVGSQLVFYHPPPPIPQVYTFGAEDVPSLVTSKSEFLNVGPHNGYHRHVAVRNIENDAQTHSVSIAQRSCRFPDENHQLDVHSHYSYSACSVQCRKQRQLVMCNCTSHLMPNTAAAAHCDMAGLRCLNDNYEELSVVIADWTHDRKGLVCDCLPSCTEIDVSVVLDRRVRLAEEERDATDAVGRRAVAAVEIVLSALPTERYKRNVVRGTLELVGEWKTCAAVFLFARATKTKRVEINMGTWRRTKRLVSMGGTTGLFIGASFLSFVELVYYFTLRPYITAWMAAAS